MGRRLIRRGDVRLRLLVPPERGLKMVYPFAPLGRGYLLTHGAYRRYANWTFTIALVLAISLKYLEFHNRSLILPVASVGALTYAVVGLVTLRGAIPMPKIPLEETAKYRGERFPIWVSLFAVLGSVGFVGVAIWLLVTRFSLAALPLLAVAILFFGACAVQGWRMVRYRYERDAA